MNEETREAIGAAVRATLESCMANYELAPMLTLEEIAERTQVSKDTIRAAVDSGDLRVYQISARLARFRVAEVNAWIDRLAVSPSPAEVPENKPEPPPMPPLPEVKGDLSDLSDLSDGTEKVDEKPSAAEASEGKPEEKPEVAQAAPEAPAPEAEQPAAPVDEKPADPEPEVQPEEPSAAEAMEGKPLSEAPETKPEEPADPWLATNDDERCTKCAPDGRRCILKAGHEAAGLKHRLIKKEN